MPCRGVCDKYKATRPSRKNTRYGLGQKRCTVCDIFTDWEGLRCPCCSGMFRTKPKGTKRRQDLMVVKNIQRI